MFWLTPVSSAGTLSAATVVDRLVGHAHTYGFGGGSQARRQVEVGDWLCFYACGKGGMAVVAHARVTAAPELGAPNPIPGLADKFPWMCRLDSESLYANRPVVVDSVMRGRLDAFRGRTPLAIWSWFVQTTRKLTEKDFERLTKPTSA
jgi:hypothetical protein